MASASEASEALGLGEFEQAGHHVLDLLLLGPAVADHG